MSDQDLRRALDELSMGAAAVGLCIARTLGKRDPTVLREIGEEANKMLKHLGDQGKIDATMVLANFYLALGNPEKMPLLSPQ